MMPTTTPGPAGPDAPVATAGPAPLTAPLTALRRHRPLLVLAAAMVALAVVAAVGLVVDPREITGAPLWAKPLKFAVSTGVYALTLAWLLALAPPRRVLRAAGTVVALALGLEVVLIVAAAAGGTTSHFNVSTPLARTVWGVMAAGVVIAWLATAVVAVLLFRADLGDPARRTAVRAGLVVGLAGMAVAFSMTGPTGAQISDYRGIVGAHTVGAPDGGPGLPLLGWSTTAGDLRVPHFVGMHALQALPLAALALELAARRVPVLRTPRVRLGLVRVLAGLAVAVLALLTGQALAGESVVHPGGAVLALAAAVAVTGATAAGLVLRRARPAPGAPRTGSPGAGGPGSVGQ